MGVADKEVLQDVPRLVGIDDDDLSGGLSTGTDPHQRGQLLLVEQLLPLLLHTHNQRERVDECVSLLYVDTCVL